MVLVNESESSFSFGERLFPPNEKTLKVYEKLVKRGRVKPSRKLDSVAYISVGSFTIAVVRLLKGSEEKLCVGISVCSPSDKYDEEIGRNVAFSEAIGTSI